MRCLTASGSIETSHRQTIFFQWPGYIVEVQGHIVLKSNDPFVSQTELLVAKLRSEGTLARQLFKLATIVNVGFCLTIFDMPINYISKKISEIKIILSRYPKKYNFAAKI